MWSRWMSFLFWYQTRRNRLINNRVLIIRMETGTFLKAANEAIQLYRASDRWTDMCVDEWWHLQLFKTYLSPFKWLKLGNLSTKSYKFGVKMKTTSTCFLWYAFNWPNVKHYWKNLTFKSVQDFFCWVYISSSFFCVRRRAPSYENQ